MCVVVMVSLCGGDGGECVVMMVRVCGGDCVVMMVSVCGDDGECVWW